MTKTKTLLVIAAGAALLTTTTFGVAVATAAATTHATTAAHSPEQTTLNRGSLDDVTQTPAHEPWPMAYTCEHNTASGEGGWVCTEDGIPANHECVVMVSVQPQRAFVVRDSSVLCEEEAVRRSEGCADMSFNPCADLDSSTVTWHYDRDKVDNRIGDDGRLS